MEIVNFDAEETIRKLQEMIRYLENQLSIAEERGGGK